LSSNKAASMPTIKTTVWPFGFAFWWIEQNKSHSISGNPEMALGCIPLTINKKTFSRTFRVPCPW